MQSSPIDDPGCVRMQLTAADEETVLRAAGALETLWPSTGPGRPYRVPGEPGVWVSFYVDTNPVPGSELLPLMGEYEYAQDQRAGSS